MQTVTASYCVICDAPEGACSHRAARYSDPVAYEPVYGPKGERIGWHIPDGDLERLDVDEQLVLDPDRAAFERTQELAAELGITGAVRYEMLADPGRAVAVLEHALALAAIRNRAGFAIANWHSGFDPRPAREPELEEAPPTLADLEYAWSLQPSAGADFMLGLMSIALSRAGGFRALQAEFRKAAVELDGGMPA